MKKSIGTATLLGIMCLALMPIAAAPVVAAKDVVAGSAENPVKKKPPLITVAEKAAIRAEFRKTLTDPESARFRWLARKSPDGNTYCGFINAKNRFGGYVGFKPYIAVVEDTFAAIISAGETDTKATANIQQCIENGIDIAGPTVDDK